MKATLVIPRPAIQAPAEPILRSLVSYRFQLRWIDDHPASHYGAGVLLASNNYVIDGVMFRHLRDSVGAWIDSDDPERIARALGVPWDEGDTEPGIGCRASRRLALNRRAKGKRQAADNTRSRACASRAPEEETARQSRL